MRGGGVENGNDGVLPVYDNGASATPTDQGLVREMRIRSGFTGNVLGFGIRKRLSEQTEILGYTAVTVGIDSVARRKFTLVDPDWRESFVRVTSFWGSFTAGRTLTLFSRGATEITYLYGYRYGLGFPGTVSDFSQSTAGSVGFGVLGNGFGAGLVYATPVLGGLQISLGGYDAVGYPNIDLLNRERWPRTEGEMTFLRNFGTTGFFKLFVNGAWQRLYDRNFSDLSSDVYGTGFGGRFEIGPFKIGLAGHWGKGVGVTYSLEPHQSVYFDQRTSQALGGRDLGYPNCSVANTSACPPVKMRTVDGAYVQTQVAAHKKLDLRAGFGVTRVHQLPEDKVQNWRTIDDPANPGTNILDPSTSVGYVTIRQQIGIGAGMTYPRRGQLPLHARVLPRGVPVVQAHSGRSRYALPAAGAQLHQRRRYLRLLDVSSLAALAAAQVRGRLAAAGVGAVVAQVAVDPRDRPARELADAQRGHELGRRPGQRQALANHGRGHGVDAGRSPRR